MGGKYPALGCRLNFFSTLHLLHLELVQYTAVSAERRSDGIFLEFSMWDPVARDHSLVDPLEAHLTRSLCCQGKVCNNVSLQTSVLHAAAGTNFFSTDLRGHGSYAYNAYRP